MFETFESGALKKLLLPSAMFALWDQLREKHGNSKGCESEHTDQASGSANVQVDCRFEREVVSFDVSVKDALVTGIHLVRPRRTSFERSREVVYLSIGQAPWTLPAFLTKTALGRPRAVAVMVHGSGPMDHNETVGNTTLFSDLASDLAKLNLASLRYDKRTLHYAIKFAQSDDISLSEETVDDARTALRELASIVPEANCVLLLAHSLGAYLAPIIIEAGVRPNGMVLLAPPGRPMSEVMLDQIRFLRSSSNSLEQNHFLTAVEEGLVKFDATSRNDAVAPPGLFSRSAWSFFKSYNPLSAWKNAAIPTLALFGDKDYQVNSKDFAAWELLAANNRLTLTVKLLANRGHVFTEVTGEPSPADYLRPARADPTLASLIAQFAERTCPDVQSSR